MVNRFLSRFSIKGRSGDNVDLQAWKNDVDRHPPQELKNRVFEDANIGKLRNISEENIKFHLASTPPCGSSPFMRLPSELLRKILAQFLPPSDEAIYPGGQGNQHSRTCDLLTLNRRLSQQLTEILYEERTFGINVYQGVHNGGIEFLNSGRQPLQQQDTFQQLSFARFDDRNSPFSVSRCKRVIITIYPESQGGSDTRQSDTRHVCMHTHFMIAALCKLLAKGEDGGPGKVITTLTIRFAAPCQPDIKGRRNVWGRRQNVMRNENPWWDATANTPRQTSVHGVSNIQVVLHPFFALCKVNRVSIELPPQLQDHEPTKAFKDQLSSSMESAEGMTELNDDLEHKFHVARNALEEWVYKVIHGGDNILDIDDTPAYDEDAADEHTYVPPQKRSRPGKHTPKKIGFAASTSIDDYTEPGRRKTPSPTSSSFSGSEGSFDEAVAMPLAAGESSNGLTDSQATISAAAAVQATIDYEVENSGDTYNTSMLQAEEQMLALAIQQSILDAEAEQSRSIASSSSATGAGVGGSSRHVLSPVAPCSQLPTPMTTPDLLQAQPFGSFLYRAPRTEDGDAA